MQGTSARQPLLPDALQKIENFRNYMRDVISDILLYNVGNVDETPVPFDTVYDRTVEVRGADSK